MSLLLVNLLIFTNLYVLYAKSYVSLPVSTRALVSVCLNGMLNFGNIGK